MKFSKFGAALTASLVIASGAVASPAQADPICPDGWYMNRDMFYGTSEFTSCGTIIGEVGSTTVSIPEGVEKIQYIVLGGGGGGGAGGGTYASTYNPDTTVVSESGDIKAGGGGAGGTVVRGELAVTSPLDLTVVVGSGGVGGTGSGTSGADGGDGASSSLTAGTTTITGLGGLGGSSGSHGGAGGDNDDYSGGNGIQNPGGDLHIAGGGGGAGAGANGTSSTTTTIAATSEGKTTDILAGNGGAGVSVTSDDWSYFDSYSNYYYGGDLGETGYGDVEWNLGAGGAAGTSINAAYGLGDNNGCDWETVHNHSVSGNVSGMNQGYGQGGCLHRMNNGDGGSYVGGWFTGGQAIPVTLEYNFNNADRNAGSFRMNPGAGGSGGASNDWENGVSSGTSGNSGIVMIRFLAPDDGNGGGGSSNGGGGNSGGSSAPAVKVTITGYVQQSHNRTNDILLSKKRAKKVRAYLKANGLVDATFTIKGKGVKGKSWKARTAIAKISWSGATSGSAKTRIYFDKWSAVLDKSDKKKLKKIIAKVPAN